ncbi:hypothetical protein SADUNF_Sadunf04G0055700 [Salix dunnii]|uniref:ALA-interacting subunit n=1 Tax=Salix dunnii TaxID=1413687 RepID=A0A835K8B0_9ROSI|nr:hypothetical protein SADUNF_Sadunf04G0055700 [Salix dunnii]
MVLPLDCRSEDDETRGEGVAGGYKWIAQFSSLAFEAQLFVLMGRRQHKQGKGGQAVASKGKQREAKGKWGGQRKQRVELLYQQIPEPRSTFVSMERELEKLLLRYVKSRSDTQVRSKGSEGATDTCQPEAVTRNGQPVVPCGLVAWSLFNDTCRFSVKNEVFDVSKKNIAWKSDQENKFGSDVYPKNFQSRSLIGGGKLNSSIPAKRDLPANTTITVIIQNNNNTCSFGGKKKLVLSTRSWLGGKDDFLGSAYLFVGALSLFLAVCFILVYVLMPRSIGDPSYLSWNRNQGGYWEIDVE